MKAQSLAPADSRGFRFTRVVGIGGIGTGVIFKFSDNHTVGRNESRLAELTSERDYCKLHIVLQNLSSLFGGPENDSIRLCAVGRVGDDRAGTELLEDMRSNGISVDHVMVSPDAPTLFSVTFQYPDGSAGNITSSNSACSLVTGDEIGGLLSTGSADGGDTIAIAVPEVPLAARSRFLAQAKAAGALTIASFASAEAGDFVEQGMPELTDILILNRDEALTLCQRSSASASASAAEHPFDPGVFQQAFDRLKQRRKSAVVVVTDGPAGCFLYKDDSVNHVAGLRAPVVTTAGAGDAFTAGVAAGLCCGLPLVADRPRRARTENPGFASCLDLAVSMGAFAVSSPGAINRELDPAALFEFVRMHDKGQGNVEAAGLASAVVKRHGGKQ
jgi:sugar/nucleoside kinase (ribokinase family)